MKFGTPCRGKCGFLNMLWPEKLYSWLPLVQSPQQKNRRHNSALLLVRNNLLFLVLFCCLFECDTACRDSSDLWWKSKPEAFTLQTLARSCAQQRRLRASKERCLHWHKSQVTSCFISYALPRLWWCQHCRTRRCFDALKFPILSRCDVHLDAFYSK